jgi:hypothetical protein
MLDNNNSLAKSPKQFVMLKQDPTYGRHYLVN